MEALDKSCEEIITRGALSSWLVYAECSRKRKRTEEDEGLERSPKRTKSHEDESPGSPGDS